MTAAPEPKAPARDRRGWLGLVVCVALAVVLATLAPDPGSDARRAWVDAGTGHPATMRGLTATVTSVTLARQAVGSGGPPFRSAQLLVLVGVRASVRNQQLLFSGVTLRTDAGDDYQPRAEFVSQELQETQPGFTCVGTEVFEVPTDRAAGSRLIVQPDPGAFDFYTGALRFDLGLRSSSPVRTGLVKVPDSVVTVTP